MRGHDSEFSHPLLLYLKQIVGFDGLLTQSWAENMVIDEDD
jgi:hypothetical protein